MEIREVGQAGLVREAPVKMSKNKSNLSWLKTNLYSCERIRYFNLIKLEINSIILLNGTGSTLVSAFHA